ncbi:MAG: hypothetical protein WDZ72_06675 [Cyclobacteriaceae bacterium]
MHLKSEDIIRLEIEYNTGEIPPPFSHVFKLKLSFSKNFINTQFDIQYTDRDDLSPDEIISEEFTMADDYSYKGEIPNLWEKLFKKLYFETKWSNQKSLGEKGGIKLLAKDIHGKITRDIPLNQDHWYQLCQEFIQAIYEISKKEAPLIIQFKEINENEELKVFMEFKFSIRKIDLTVNGTKKNIEWEEGRELASHIFIPDYDYELAQEAEPTQPGIFIDCGDGYWHEFSNGVFNLDEGFDAKGKIIAEFRKLNQL